MKVCYLSYEYPGETDFGGIGRATYYASHGMRDLGHEVYVISGAATHKHELRDVDGIKVMRSKINGHDPYLNKMRSRLARSQQYCFQSRLETAYTMYRSFEELKITNDFDVVQMPESGAEGFFLAKRAHEQHKVVKLHSPLFMLSPYYSMNQEDLRATEKVENVPLKYADTIIAPSEYVAENTKKHMSLDRDITVIPNGVDISEIDGIPEIDVCDRFKIPSNARIIFFSSRLEGRKGAHLLPEIIPAVVAQYPDAYCVISGNDYNDLNFDLEQELVKRGMKDHFLMPGKLERPFVINFLRICDVYMYPALWSNSPCSILEAMACKTPIVAFNTGGIAEMIEHERDGLVVDDISAEHFADAVISLLSDKSHARKYADQARSSVEQKYDHKKVAQQMLDIYKN